MKNNKCCLCNSNKFRIYKIVGKFRLLKCKKCSLVGLDQNFTSQADFISDAKKNLDDISREKVEYWSFPYLYKKHNKVFKRFFNERLLRVGKFNRNIKNMLDIGCGYGFWMKYCENRGIQSDGIDISREVVDYAKKKLKLRAYVKDFMEFRSNKRYDLIMMFDIIEHMQDPNKMLIKCKNHLTTNGLLYIQVPNLIGFKIPLNHGYGLPYHLWQFSYKTLNMLLKKNGYAVLGHWTGPMGVIGEYEKNKNIFLKELMWKISSKLYLGNRLQIIAKVKDNRGKSNGRL